jgi:hypothetical protein
MNWPVDVDWESPAGKLLTLLGNAVPPDRRTPIVLFGSAALQVTVAPTVLSNDADIAPDIIPYDARSGEFPNPYDRKDLTDLVRAHELGVHQRKLYLQVNAPGAFQPGTGYLRRVMEKDRGNLHITIPHPLDILIAKLHRYEEKDLEAFQKVYAQTGFPSPEALLAELRASPRLFARQNRSLEHMPSQYPESKISKSVPHLFWTLWKKRISVPKDILAPTHQEIASSYRDFGDGHKTNLTDIAATSLAAKEKAKQKEDAQSSRVSKARAMLQKSALRPKNPQRRK